MFYFAGTTAQWINYKGAEKNKMDLNLKGSNLSLFFFFYVGLDQLNQV